MPLPVIAIIDIGKTNKKIFLFDEFYHVVYERSEYIPEIEDEDGDPCENIHELIHFINRHLLALVESDQYKIKAVNFSAYGASFVCVDASGEVIAPFYNYLKPYPEHLKKKFYQTYGGEELLSLETASPVLGSLNSGMQLYRLKYDQPVKFSTIKYALHLPQFVSYLISRKAVCEFTSLGCHTNLIAFDSQRYHQWVFKEGLDKKFPETVSATEVSTVTLRGKSLVCGVGLHDSSAALIPYLTLYSSPFVLISTGTWCISLNPFNQTPLTVEELREDCLCYLTFDRKSVKASRLFSGHDYDIETRRIASHFNVKESAFQSLLIDFDIVRSFESRIEREFATVSLEQFSSYVHAYHFLVYTLVLKQVRSTNLVLRGSQVACIFVDGGFSKNDVFMNLLSAMYADKDVYATTIAQGTALGAAMAIHKHWNSKSIPSDLIKLVKYSAKFLN